MLAITAFGPDWRSKAGGVVDIEDAMQIMMSEAAYARVRQPLAQMGPDLKVVTIDADGGLSQDGAALSGVDPEVFWVSLDLYRTSALGKMFGTIMAGSNGRWTQVFAAGLDNPVFTRLMAKGMRLSKSSAQAPAIAEYVVCRTLAMLHPIEAFRQAQAERRWEFVGFREIASTKWLMVGFGAIGVEIARRLQPFGADLTVVRRNLGAEALANRVIATSQLLQALPEADVVVLACALNEDTRGMADAAFFAALKPGALLVNIGRGGLVDEAALKDGLDRDQPAAAILDVVETEPLPSDSWFWDHPKIQLTPHCSGGGDGVLARGDLLFLENLRRYRAGESLLNEAARSEVGL